MFTKKEWKEIQRLYAICKKKYCEIDGGRYHPCIECKNYQENKVISTK